MPIINTEYRYGRASIALHWAMFLLIALTYAAIELRGFWPKGTPTRDLMKTLHFTLGLSVLALVLARIGLRLAAGPAPAIKPAPAAWQQKASAAVHGLLYLFMIAMPIAGWIILSAEGKSVQFLGLTLPALVAQSKPLAKSIKEMHEVVGDIGFFVIGLHALAALVHHYRYHDNTLARMMPGRSTNA